MRFDDSLATVLAADTGSAQGAAAAWRQLVDLLGRGRAADVDGTLARLRDLRPRVAEAVRRASGRALVLASPPAPLVRLFAEDTLATAAPVLRSAQLGAFEWLELLPSLSPAARAVLRHRRDLPAEVVRGLASFGATDFVLDHDGPPAPAPTVIEPLLAASTEASISGIAPATAEPAFAIAELVARIDAFRREQPPAVSPAAAVPIPDQFQFHADAAGVIRWIEGVDRAALIGVMLTTDAPQGLATVGPEVGAALRRREAFRGGVLTIGGGSSAAGSWRLAGKPRFDRASGGFTGVAGIARRVEAHPAASAGADSLRQLVHELRTPANAIAGFAELIGSELLGPVPPVYRERAALIQRQGGALTEAIADLDTAARIEGEALETRAVPFDLAPVVAEAVAGLQGVARARHCALTLLPTPEAQALADDRAARRLVERLLAATVAAALPGERLQVQLVAKTRSVRLHVTRPRALPVADDRLLTIDGAAGADDLLPLGVGFTLGLVRSLAAALGGSLAIAPDRLTLRLPAPVTAEMERTTTQ